MPLTKSCLLTFALLVLAWPAFSWDGVEITDSAGLLRREIYADPSPTPGFCYWDKDEAGGPTFHATNDEGFGNFCIDPWLVHCDTDSLVYRGSWPLIDGLYVRSSAYRVELSCTVDIFVATRLKVRREVTDNLDTDEHMLTIVFPDETEWQFSDSAPNPFEVQMDLDPGVYQVTLTIDALQATTTGTVIDPYVGSLVVKWEDPAGVAVEPMSWSSLKAIFR